MDLRHTSLGIAGLCLVLTCTQAAELPVARGPSVLSRLAASVAKSDPLVQADFAAIALDAVIAAYEQELTMIQGMSAGVDRRRSGKRQRWARGARSLLDQLYAARDDIDTGNDVEVLVGAPGEIQVLVADRLLPVASPRIARPEALEREVVYAFCNLYSCDAVIMADAMLAGSAKAGGWSFAQGLGSTYFTADGLGFMFDNIRNRPQKEQLCMRAAEELRLVLKILQRARELGIAINWDDLQILPDTTALDERLVLGYEGQGSRVFAPILLRAPGVLQVAQPWLRAMVDKRRVEQLFPRADLLFANLLGG